MNLFCLIFKNWKHFVLILISSILIVLISYTASAATGKFCNSTSPCECGAQCNGGYETGNDFNTIDGHLIVGCSDGADYSFEHTSDINVTDLERSTFTEGDSVRVRTYVKCDGSGDYVVLLYHNGTRWRNMDYSVCLA